MRICRGTRVGWALFGSLCGMRRWGCIVGLRERRGEERLVPGLGAGRQMRCRLEGFEMEVLSKLVERPGEECIYDEVMRSVQTYIWDCRRSGLGF